MVYYCSGLWRFFGEIVTERKKAQSFFWVQGTNLEGVPRETTIRGDVTCDLIYPCIHQHESEAESQGEAFRALFRD